MIHLPLGVYTLTIPGPGEDQAATGDLDLLGDVTIVGRNDFNRTQTAIIDGNGLDRVFDGIGSYSISLSNLTVRNGTCLGCEGGGIRTSSSDLSLYGCNVEGNRATYSGGGIFSLNGGLIIYNSVIDQNQSGVGGGIYHQGGPVKIHYSTISQNIASSSGGGIFTNNETRITNSTISGNQADVNGGGIFHEGSLLLDHVTLAQNTSNTLAGGIHNQFGFTTTMTSTLLAQNTAPAGADCSGGVISAGHNLVGTLSGCSYSQGSGDITGADPLIGPLQDNGNFAQFGKIGGGTPGMYNATQTHALDTGSPAIDAGACVFMISGVVEPDQRQYDRPQDGDDDGVSACDIGAYEAPRRTWATFDPLGTVGGAALNVERVGNYAILGAGSQVQVYNVANPQQPALLGQASISSALVTQMVVSGTLAYVTDGNYGLHIIDLSDPAQPQEVGPGWG